jgi:hypothetical protein
LLLVTDLFVKMLQIYRVALHSRLRDWYHALLACDTIVAPGALPQLGPAQAFLEEMLEVRICRA